MNSQVKAGNVTALLIKRDPTTPALLVTGRDTIAIKGGTVFAGCIFPEDTPLHAPASGFEVGTDYGVAVDVDDAAPARIEKLPTSYSGWKYLGGFHFAPGGNAAARDGGDSVPAIIPSRLGI